jgi:prolyl-tRNA editing enzyme YbaK/EbsC (Cys-tRNA(Pro) deacylase)
LPTEGKYGPPAGQRGLQIIITPDDYVRATKATLAEISHEKK